MQTESDREGAGSCWTSVGLSVDKIDGQEMVGWTLMGGRDGEKRDERMGVVQRSLFSWGGTEA